MGRSAARALQRAGHAVVGLARDDANAECLAAEGVEPVRARLFDPDSLAEAFAGCTVVCNMATCAPIGMQALRSRAWRAHDRIRSEGSRSVVAAARRAGVQRIVQESASALYADAGEEWIDERSPITVNRAVEPAVLAEANAEDFGGATRDWVVLRFGAIVGDDAFTAWRLARARTGHAIGLGDPRGWTHLVHSDDVGSAVLASLSAPSGTYNVGAQPVRRIELVDAFAEAVGRTTVGYMPRVLQRIGGERAELLTRSQRVSSDALMQAAAWKPVHRYFGVEWLTEKTAERV
jgi:nucleoside-diphosphate-sugar epimerase